MTKPIHPETIEQLKLTVAKYPTCKLAVYENHAMDSSQLGHLKFLAVGPDNSLQVAPTRLPDMEGQINWAYQLVGYVNKETWEIEPI